MVELLESRGLPIEELTLLASERSAGETMLFHGEPNRIYLLEPKRFSGVDFALFSAGSAVSREFAPIAAAQGAVVIDNSNCWRMDADVPLVVPEVNPREAFAHKKGIVAVPNSATIQLVVVLQPLHRAVPIRRVVVATYQSASVAGKRGMDELAEQTVAILNQKPFEVEVHPQQLAFNCIPQIGSFLDNGYTEEEMALVYETRKIMGDDAIEISPTAVRVPVFCGHSEVVNIEFEHPISADEVREILRAAPGVTVEDDTSYPTAINCPSEDAVFVGRVRQDPFRGDVINLWIVTDNLRKGAALNAVQIAELLIFGQH